MKIVLEMHCPKLHDTPSSSRFDRAGHLASLAYHTMFGRRCPACPDQTLEPGLTRRDSGDVETGYCPCCEATWVHEAGLTCLSAGRLTGHVPTASGGRA
ncbi:hypothetical protein AB0M45_25630 [Nocardia sp. NPDC051787]|uniref:hypothetical protein n=1 Tax=Nocardia sp. NPDC051787 TaxID=3155415 RepID=UPI00341F2670